VILKLVLVGVAYVLGSIPSALLVVRRATGKDVREEGSGNVGATNAARTAGWRVGVLVTVMDVAKGALPMWAMESLDAGAGWIAATLLAAVIGHCFPVWLGFRGGKGVATGLGAFVVLDPRAAGLAILLWVVILLVSRWVSVASMIASACFPLLLVMVGDPGPTILGAVLAAAVLIVSRHLANVRLLLSGEEPRIETWRRR
jgi:glycerol-3-phosphate acyltransferase PlsY